MTNGEWLGRQIGNYRLERVLGSGGFANVYLGKHVYLESAAAIKLLATSLTAQEVESFRREARTLIHLIHPHIIRLLDFGIQEQVPFLVMDYAPHGTLRQRHQRGEQIPLPTVVSYVKQIASALQHAHDQKVIHCDIKPENILLGQHDELLLSDFGIAIVAQSTRTHLTQEMTGTITYMAPEQIQTHPRAASDQYALGIMAYEWLSGYPPFSGGFTEIAMKQVMAVPPGLRERLPTLPAEVEQVINIALAKDPERRFGTIQAFATALEQASRNNSRPEAEIRTLLQPGALPTPSYAEDAYPTLLSNPGVSPIPETQIAAPVATSLQPAPIPNYPARTVAVSTQANAPTVSVRAEPKQSRRGFLLVGGAALGVAAAGGLAWALITHPFASPTATHLVQSTPSPQASTPSPRPATPVPQVPSFLARDTFQRPDQPFWGTADTHETWGGQANKLTDFSIVGGKGQLLRTAPGRNLYTATLGLVHADLEITVSATLSHFNPSHIGVMLRYTDDKNYYKVLLDGQNLNMIRRLGGNNTTLQNARFKAQDQTYYTIRFQIVGNTLRAKVWPTALTEPNAWLLTAKDPTFASGLGGLRPQLDQNATLLVASFLETRP